MKKIVSSILKGLNLKKPNKLKKPYKSLYLYRNDDKRPTLFEFTDYDENGEFLKEYRVAILYVPIGQIMLFCRGKNCV